MAFERMKDDLNIIAKLGDVPGSDDGISTQELKALFDKASLLLQSFINDSLIPEIEKQNVGLPIGGGTMEGAINMNGQPLLGLNVPTEKDNPVTLGYATENFASREYANSRNVENHCDNSDFTQWVAQAGIGGKHGNQDYAGDRWILDSGTVTGDANANGNGYSNIKLNGTIRQIISNPPAVGSVFVEMVSGTATASYQNGEVTITSNGGVIRNVLLCEGQYTEANRPKYQPKGYGVELLECQRYFVLFVTANIYGVSSNGSVSASIVLPTTMRITPTINITELWCYYPTGNAIKVTFVSVSKTRNHLMVRFSTSSNSNYPISIPDFTAHISADL